MKTIPPSHMASEIAEQPRILRDVMARRPEIAERVRSVLPREITGFALVGRGSSGNAALFGRYLLEMNGPCPATIVPPSMLRLYRTGASYEGFVAIALGQSGQTPEVTTALDILRQAGAKTIAITADPTSPLGVNSDLCLDLRTGPERAVPATKTFTAELAMLLALTDGITHPSTSSGDWRAMIDAVEVVLEDWRSAVEVAARLKEPSYINVLAAGMLLPIALEVALKIEETAQIPSTGRSVAGYRHGPLATARSDRPIIALAGAATAKMEVMRSVAELRARGVPVYLMDTAPEADLNIGSPLSEWFLAIPAAVRGQQLALALALQLELDPDRPPYLEKVTAT